MTPEGDIDDYDSPTSPDDTDATANDGGRVIGSDGIEPAEWWVRVIHLFLGGCLVFSIIALGLADALPGYDPSPEWGALFAILALVFLGFGAIAAKILEVIT